MTRIRTWKIIQFSHQELVRKKFYLSYNYRRISNWINICNWPQLLRIKLPYGLFVLIRSNVKKWKSSRMSSKGQIGQRT